MLLFQFRVRTDTEVWQLPHRSVHVFCSWAELSEPCFPWNCLSFERMNYMLWLFGCTHLHMSSEKLKDWLLYITFLPIIDIRSLKWIWKISEILYPLMMWFNGEKCIFVIFDVKTADIRSYAGQGYPNDWYVLWDHVPAKELLKVQDDNRFELSLKDCCWDCRCHIPSSLLGNVIFYIYIAGEKRPESPGRKLLVCFQLCYHREARILS